MTKMWDAGFVDLGRGIYCYVTGGEVMMSNCCMVVGEKCALVFDVLSTKSKTAQFLEECRKRTDKPIRYFALSHCHGDHFLGANALGDVTMISHESVEKSMQADKQRDDADPGKLARTYPHLDFTDRVYPSPDIMIPGDRNHITVDLGGRVVELHHAGHCHTPGDIFLYVPDAKFAALGDILFHYVAPVAATANLNVWTDTLRRIYDMELDQILPGHGPVCGKRALLELNHYFELVKQVGLEMAMGERELQDEIPCPEEQNMLDKGWKETSRFVVGAEKYAAQIKGETYVINMPRIYRLEELRTALRPE